MQSPREQQGEIRRSSSMNSANKQREKLNADDQIFKKIGDIKGIFHARMGTINDRNGKDLTEAAGIEKR